MPQRTRLIKFEEVPNVEVKAAIQTQHHSDLMAGCDRAATFASRAVIEMPCFGI